MRVCVANQGLLRVKHQLFNFFVSFSFFFLPLPSSPKDLMQLARSSSSSSSSSSSTAAQPLPQSAYAVSPRSVEQNQCNCRNSRCLKLYCECFAAGTYCDNCNCSSCLNNAEHEKLRREAIELTLERNPNAFQKKIATVALGKKVFLFFFSVFFLSRVTATKNGRAVCVCACVCACVVVVYIAWPSRGVGPPIPQQRLQLPQVRMPEEIL